MLLRFTVSLETCSITYYTHMHSCSRKRSVARLVFGFSSNKVGLKQWSYSFGLTPEFFQKGADKNEQFDRICTH